MKLRQTLRVILMTLAVASIAMPIVSEASCHGKRHMGWGCMGAKHGIIFNETDGRYYSVPSNGHRMVYRSVDGKYIPVEGYGRRMMVNVSCQPKPGFWWMTTWMAPHMECYYVR